MLGRVVCNVSTRSRLKIPRQRGHSRCCSNRHSISHIVFSHFLAGLGPTAAQERLPPPQEKRTHLCPKEATAFEWRILQSDAVRTRTTGNRLRDSSSGDSRAQWPLARLHARAGVLSSLNGDFSTPPTPRGEKRGPIKVRKGPVD